MTAQNYPIEIAQDFEHINDFNILADVLTDPMQDFKGATLPNLEAPLASTSSLGHQRKMSRTMAKSVSQWVFYGNTNCTIWHPKELVTDKRKQTSSMICISNFKHTCKIPLHSCRDDG
jgi:hypothetical protein